jgi:transcriptional regulator with XRE-family HTH domain
MPTRSLKLQLRKLLERSEKYKRESQEAIAQAFGITENTLRKYLRNEVLSYEGRILERICDVLDVGIEDLLALVPCDFFPHGEHLHLLRTKPEIDPDDFEALGSLAAFFDRVPVEPQTSSDFAELAHQIYSNDCVIVGSPHHNGAGEIALSLLFGADPLDTSDQNRRKLPLLMEVPSKWQTLGALTRSLPVQDPGPLPCRVSAPESAEKEDKRVFREKKPRATADYYPPDQFQEAIDKARDFGVILVADHWIPDREPPVRTYWLSGFSSVGTLASLRVIQRDVRSFSLDTSRERPGEFVLAIVQATFSKGAGSRKRNLLDDYEIVHTIRGSLPGTVLSPEGTSVGDPDARTTTSDEVPHNKRFEEFRIIVTKTWRNDVSKETPKLEKFYDSELRQLSQDAFEGMLRNLENRFAHLSPERRPKSLDSYFGEVRKAQDGGSGRLF